mmetsp:Transcript_45895/g.33653  ORF Transcript_45895/g.33653 Transcript_45895/m.33653 type:complete len:122 (-) Transcript_45895:1230-1595(-)
MDQRTREERLNLFRSKKVRFLIVTDLAARGLDIPLLANVIHYDFPTKLKIFIHRSGRTARNGEKGCAFCLVSKDEAAYMHDLSAFVGRKYSTALDSLPDPSIMSFGGIPQRIIDYYSQEVA